MILRDDTPTPFALALSQDRTESLLLQAVTSTGIGDVRFDTEVLGFEEDSHGIKLRVRSPQREQELHGCFLVGADGAHSIVRETLGLELEGKTYPTRALLADVRMPPDKDQTEFWPEADVDALLDSHADERRGYVEHSVQPTTNLMERFESAPTFVRERLVWWGVKLFNVGGSAHAITRRVSMLDVSYGRSALLKSDKSPVGSRIPDVIGSNGHRLLGNQCSAVILHAAYEGIAKELASALKLPLLDGDVAELAKFFGRDRFVAIIRPDRIVGWLGDADTFDIDTCAGSLGIRRLSARPS